MLKKKLGELKNIPMSRLKKQLVDPAETGGTCLILNGLAILMRREKNDFTNWTFSKKNLIYQFYQKDKTSLTKN